MSILNEVPSEAKCRQMVAHAIFGKRPFCPRCGSTHIKVYEGRYRCRGCRRPFSITSVSWLKGMRISYQTLYLLLVCWQRKTAFNTTPHIAGVSGPTVRRYFKLFRTHLVYESPQLSGVVEVDESWLGKRKHGNQTIAIGGIERDTGTVVIRIMKHRDQEWSDRFLIAHVKLTEYPIFTDGWEGYRGIDRFFGYPHKSCIHAHGDFGPTNHIENVWSRLKGFIKRTWHHCWKENLPHLLREFEARINTPELFDSPQKYLETCLSVVPST